MACLLALGLAMSWTLGGLAVFGVSINLANFFAIPILIGLGADSAIHVLHRWRLIRTGEERTFGETLNAVTLTACTTGLGFGTLVFAHHQGLQGRCAAFYVGMGMHAYACHVWLRCMLRDGAYLDEVEDVVLRTDEGDHRLLLLRRLRCLGPLLEHLLPLACGDTAPIGAVDLLLELIVLEDEIVDAGLEGSDA